MKKISLFLSLFLLLITACNKQENVTTGNNIQNNNNSPATAEIDPDTGCKKIPGNLTDAEEINLEEIVKKSGQLTAGKYRGYTFEGTKGQKFNYSTPNNICLWIVQPNTQLLDGVELPIDGKYTVQITIPQGSSTFELEMSLNNDNLVSNNNEFKFNSVNNVKSIGWIRIGAINGKNEPYEGEMMIKTSQPVTIAPTTVPKIGDEVRIITNVNLRENFPQPPDYNLANSVSILSSGQKFIILNLETFVDNNSSNHRIIWAEIGVK